MMGTIFSVRTLLGLSATGLLALVPRDFARHLLSSALHPQFACHRWWVRVASGLALAGREPLLATALARSLGPPNLVVPVWPPPYS